MNVNIHTMHAYVLIIHDENTNNTADYNKRGSPRDEVIPKLDVTIIKYLKLLQLTKTDIFS